MAKVSDREIESIGQKVLIYGPPKTGKTLLASLLAREFDLIWLDLEHGSLTLKQLPLELQRKIELIEVPDSRTNCQAITTMLEITDGKAIKVCDKHGKVGSCSDCNLAKATGRLNDVGGMVDIDIEKLGPKVVVVMDSLTQCSHSAMAKTFGDKAKNASFIKPEFGNYSGQGFYLDRILTAIQNSKANWVVISHEESIEQEDGKEKLVPVAGTRSFSKSSARYFDHVIYTHISNMKHVALSSGLDNMQAIAGSRTGVSIKDLPNYDALIQIFRGIKEIQVGTTTTGTPVTSLQAKK